MAADRIVHLADVLFAEHACCGVRLSPGVLRSRHLRNVTCDACLNIASFAKEAADG